MPTTVLPSTVNIFPTAPTGKFAPDGTDSPFKVLRVALYGTTGVTTPHPLAFAPLTESNGDLVGDNEIDASAVTKIIMHAYRETSPGSGTPDNTNLEAFDLAEGDVSDEPEDVKYKYARDGGPDYGFSDFPLSFFPEDYRTVLIEKPVTIEGKKDGSNVPLTVITRTAGGTKGLNIVTQRWFVTLRDIHFDKIGYGWNGLQFCHPFDMDNCHLTGSPDQNIFGWAYIPEEIVFNGGSGNRGAYDPTGYNSYIRNCKFIDQAWYGMELQGSHINVINNLFTHTDAFVGAYGGNYAWSWAVSQWATGLGAQLADGVRFTCFDNKFSNNQMVKSPDGLKGYYNGFQSVSTPVYLDRAQRTVVEDNVMELVDPFGSQPFKFFGGHEPKINRNNTTTVGGQQLLLANTIDAYVSDNVYTGVSYHLGTIWMGGCKRCVTDSNDFSASGATGVGGRNGADFWMYERQGSFSHGNKLLETASYDSWGGVENILGNYVFDETRTGVYLPMINSNVGNRSQSGEDNAAPYGGFKKGILKRGDLPTTGGLKVGTLS